MSRRDRRGWCPGTTDQDPHLADNLGKPRNGVSRCPTCQRRDKEINP